jgi:hypothetical protein
MEHEHNTGTHKHKCDFCGFVWEHEDSCINNTKAHTCVICLNVQWYWDYMPDKAFSISCASMPQDTKPEIDLSNVEDFFRFVDGLTRKGG